MEDEWKIDGSMNCNSSNNYSKMAMVMSEETGDYTMVVNYG